MRIETTPTYRRFFLGRHYMTWIFEKSRDLLVEKRSDLAACNIITLASKLTPDHTAQMRDYFNELLRKNRGT